MRSFLLVAALWSGALPAADLRVAVLVQDAAQVSLRGDLVPSSTPGADLVAFTDELAHEICRRIRSRCAFSYVTFGEILPGVEDGSFDLGFGNFLRAPKREKRVAFGEPIFRSASRLVASPATARAFAGKLGQAVTLDNLRGARVAAMEGSKQQEFLDAIAAERELSVVATATTAGAFDALRNGRVDFALLPIRTGYALISHDKSRRFGFVGPAVADHGLGDTVHIILPRQKEALRRSVNQAIAEIRADGTGHRIMRRHFPVILD
ncbi:MAG: amino acid ABC transporter substrate-binding protein [Dechloromonas sp.]|nr:MAG: amino acid ABC transporter substrate-binding protein [Dechloromonas sp.]